MRFTKLGNGAIMKHPRAKLLMVSLAAAIYLLAAVSALADVERVYGKALNADGDLVFLEEHIVKYENDRIASIKTIYYDAGLKKIGEQVSDFSHGPQFGSYDFKDDLVGILAKIFLFGAGLRSFFAVDQNLIRHHPGAVMVLETLVFKIITAELGPVRKI
jgi:hypothetical protein